MSANHYRRWIVRGMVCTSLLRERNWLCRLGTHLGRCTPGSSFCIVRILDLILLSRLMLGDRTHPFRRHYTLHQTAREWAAVHIISLWFFRWPKLLYSIICRDSIRFKFIWMKVIRCNFHSIFWHVAATIWIPSQSCRNSYQLSPCTSTRIRATPMQNQLCLSRSCGLWANHLLLKSGFLRHQGCYRVREESLSLVACDQAILWILSTGLRYLLLCSGIQLCVLVDALIYICLSPPLYAD